jgi:hypothetical protein
MADPYHTTQEKPLTKFITRREVLAAVSLGILGAAGPSRADEVGPQGPWYLRDYIDGVWHQAIASVTNGGFIDTIFVVGHPHRPDRPWVVYLGFGGDFVATVGTYAADAAAAVAAELSRRHVYPVVHLPRVN